MSGMKKNSATEKIQTPRAHIKARADNSTKCRPLRQENMQIFRQFHYESPLFITQEKN